MMITLYLWQKPNEIYRLAGTYISNNTTISIRENNKCIVYNHDNYAEAEIVLIENNIYCLTDDNKYFFCILEKDKLNLYKENKSKQIFEKENNVFTLINMPYLEKTSLKNLI